MHPVALIIGASSGMGFASAEKLAQQGFDLILVYRARRTEAQAAEEAFAQWRKNGARVWAYNKDALQADVISSILQEAQSNGLLINLILHSLAKGNLKAMVPKPAEETAKQSFLQTDDFLLTLNAMAVNYYTWTVAVFNKSLLAPKASFIALTSEGARKAWRFYGAVSAAKAALEAINRQLAVELGAHGHRANILQPGVTNTTALRMIPGHEELLAWAEKRSPTGALTTPQKVADVVYLLSQPESAWINGTVIPVDGGESIT
jgi:enoyl-[acyl-carrier protein] reductase I